MADVEETNSTTRHHPQGSAAGREDAAHTVEDAFERTGSAKESGTAAARVRAGELLQDAVDQARDAGVGWERIGDILGIARGNAYHRHRKRPK